MAEFTEGDDPLLGLRLGAFAVGEDELGWIYVGWDFESVVGDKCQGLLDAGQSTASELEACCAKRSLEAATGEAEADPIASARVVELDGGHTDTQRWRLPCPRFLAMTTCNVVRFGRILAWLAMLRGSHRERYR